MKIKNIGEFPFINRIKEKMPQSLPEGVIGIGDDCAVLPWENDRLMLVSTDALVEGIHFIKDKISPENLGYKLIMVNLSDIAAMGGKPLFAFMTIAIPSETEGIWLDAFLEGVNQACKEGGIALLGGDTTGSKAGIFLNVTVLGEIKKGHVKYRSAAIPGDVVCVTGSLGGSLGGYEKIMAGQESSMVAIHCRPKAQLQEGQWLGKNPAVHAMIDLSDGVHQDLQRIMEASHCGVEVDLQTIPVLKAFEDHCREKGYDAQKKAVISGEEYSLMLTVDNKSFPAIKKDFYDQFHKELYPIGIITTSGKLIYIINNKEEKINDEGYLHFNDNL